MHIYKCLCYEFCKSEDELLTLSTYSWEGKHLGRNSEGEEGGWVGGLDANTEWRRNAAQTNNDPSHQGAPLLAYNINVIFTLCIENMVGDTNVSCKTVCLKPDKQLSKIDLSLIPQLLSSHSDFNGQI